LERHFKSLFPKEEPAPSQNYSNPFQVSRFLRLVRLPFLTLMALPALLPYFFVNLPRSAPLVQNIQQQIFFDGKHRLLGIFNLQGMNPDVDSWCAYWYAAAVWLFGLWCGVMIVKGFVLSSQIVSSGPRNRERSISLYFFFAAIVFAFMSVPWLYGIIAPGVAILAYLGLMALTAALFALLFEGRCKQWKRWRLVALIVVVGWVSCMNSALDSFRFEKLDYSRPDPPSSVTFRHDLRKETRGRYLNKEQPLKKAAEGCGPLVLDQKALKQFRERCQGSTGSPDGRPKLVVVCTSGGAIRAGYWTATVLDRLGQEISCKPKEGAPQPFRGDFHTHVRVITGASGGMVGAAYYVTWLRDQRAAGGAKPVPPCGGWIAEIPIFSLSPVARSIALRDPITTLFRRAFNFFGFYPDRGRVLEDDWQALRYPISSLRDLEACGALPSLIFSPMTVEDGRRLLISNLDLKTLFVAPKDKDALQPPPPLPSERDLALNSNNVILSSDFKTEMNPVSISAVEFFKVFCPLGNNNLFLSTAARMSASFPYVSPAVYLPSEPPVRVVDAGYYDTYGVDLAAAWIFANRFWILEHTSGVLIVQIRDSLSQNDRLGFPVKDDSLYSYTPWFRGLQTFFSPIEGVTSARYASSAFRNDSLIAGLSDYFSERTQNRKFLTTAIFELASRTVQPIRQRIWEWPGDKLDRKIKFADSSRSTEVAMSWYLTVAERQAIDMAIPYDKKPDCFDNDGYVAGEGTDGHKLLEALDLKDPELREFTVEKIAIEDLKKDARARQGRIRKLENLSLLIRDLLRDKPRLLERAIYVIDKELARAQNYERFREIENWWPGRYDR
jgi:hypothetical protein